MTDTLVFDVTDATFEVDVVERSRDVPVIVDFWAAWCGPCRTLGPMIEAAVQARAGRVVLAKIDVDANQATAQRFRVQGIPQVHAFRDGVPVAQFTGVIPAPQLDAFLDDLVPSPRDEVVAAVRDLPRDEAEPRLRAVLDADPTHRGAAIALAGHLVEDDPHAALALLTPHRPDPAAEAVALRAQLAIDGSGDVDGLRAAVEGGDDDARIDLARAMAARGDHDAAIEELLIAVQISGELREAARGQLVALFTMLGDADTRVAAARVRLARALF
ncbi:MAG: tetratricopeptide repeat protein [Nitriliruptoraceae bacterium]